jgi:hypothetical protein
VTAGTVVPRLLGGGVGVRRRAEKRSGVKLLWWTERGSQERIEFFLQMKRNEI